MLSAYLPVLVFLILGLGVGAAFTVLNRVLGPRRPSPVKRAPYECGLPSEFQRNFRFGISFYLVAMLFILFDVEVILLYPVAVVMGESLHALGAIALFIFFLAVAFLVEWRRGSLDWR
jgi:NADH-quinone oxidoreductase subunit A